ncbi:MAG TPA: ATP-grasp domain-containing protein, partial [Rhodopila sp.]
LIRLQPDFVIPCDERTVRDLHGIWRTTQDQNVKELIEKSTAPAENFPTITSRAALLSLAQRQGARVPASSALRDAAELGKWTEANAAPFVLKADGSWAGFGVRIISNAATAADAYQNMTRRASGFLAVRESFLEGNHFGFRPWLRGERPAMSVQAYVDGWPANVGVACWQGEVLAAVCAESVATTSATGPSTVARIIQNTEMIETAKRVVAALRLSGMIGFDFMIEAATGAAYLIEMNPRNTPICAVRLGPGRDLAEALVARLASRPVRERPARTERDIVVFFPDTWREDPANHFLHSGYHDVPWEQPELVRALMQPELRDRYWFLRLLRRAYLAVQTRNERPR